MWSILKSRTDKGFQAAYANFLSTNKAYKKTMHIDTLRDKEFSILDEQGHVYLDFTGGNLYARKLVTEHAAKLASNVYGNPHSSNPTSNRATKVTESARDYILRYLNTDRNEYVCIFTQNASGALKLLGEAYPFKSGDHFLLTFDNHNSVNGIREFARKNSATFNYTPIRRSDLRIDREKLLENLDQHVDGKNKLFAFPAQSNVSGVKHDLEWINIAKQKGWDVLLDAAAFVPSDKLDLSKYKPDFVSMSFYKIFGYPTGLGCLLVHRSKFEKLRRPWFAGGTITIVSVQGDNYYYEKDNAMFEDGTINYLDIPAIESGLRYIESVGIESINIRIQCITGWMLQQLLSLKHDNGRSLIKIYGPQDTSQRGGTIAMNFFDKNGEMYDFLEIEKKANELNISLRTGCFCNPGIDETNHSLEEGELKKYFSKMGAKNYFDLIETLGKRRGAVRISFGYVSKFSDAYKFMNFAKGFLNVSRPVTSAVIPSNKSVSKKKAVYAH
ncbi:aminotransferase class V-fold PLP-dependent enzyme [Sporocytophaga myxococcoides]|uniref:aminotransferase class V-fold PLP-dependent enzyme n=1 Tax=Sporocytophaga myxococcoides TaxID=153721 RepID=UPI00041FCE28|nr:aminotransferase class V-fold PLP-dependent enzyme [Sporocytophaga myxococcoides]